MRFEFWAVALAVQQRQFAEKRLAAKLSPQIINLRAYNKISLRGTVIYECGYDKTFCLEKQYFVQADERGISVP